MINKFKKLLQFQKILKFQYFSRQKSGYVLILVALMIPIVLMSIDYSVKKLKLSHSSTIKTSASLAIGQAALRKYNPAKTWDKQKDKVYSAAAQALNDRAFELKHDMHIAAAYQTVYNLEKNLSADISSLTSADNDSFTLAKMYIALSSYGLNNLADSRTFFAEYVHRDTTPITNSSLFCDDFPLINAVFNPSGGKLSFKMRTLSGSTEAYSTVYYDPALNENSKNLLLSLNTSSNNASNYIKCEVKCLGKTVRAYPARCDVDIILTLPTNHAACTSNNSNSGTLIAPNSTTLTPIVAIARSYQTFLKSNFSRVAGVAVGVVPYSAKISIPPNREDWTIAIPAMTTGSGSSLKEAVPNPPYIKQAAAYGTDGHMGGDIATIDVLYEWGRKSVDVGFPIMFRCGITESYRGVNIYRGSASTSIPSTDSTRLSSLLISNEEPTGAKRFLRMNLNPCYLGHCNILAGACERTCPTYMANPYFITELTDDLENVIYDLSLIRPINDPKNKSNFLFLAVQWAHNLLSSWTAHPEMAFKSGQKFAHPARSSKKRAVILVVNAPDHFEPQELTYLGFNNDASEIPMFEADNIDFSRNYGAPTNNALTTPLKGIKGAITFSVTSGSVAYNSVSGCYISPDSATCNLTFPKKGLVKIVVNTNSFVTFYSSNQVSDCKVGSTAVALDTPYPLEKMTTFTFSGPTKTMWNWAHNSVAVSGNANTGGVNFGHNLSLYKLRYSFNYADISSATLTNQILRGYGNYDGSKTLIKNNNYVTNSSSYWDPCIDTKTGHNSGGSYSPLSSGQVDAYNFFVVCYGLTKNSRFLLYGGGSFSKYDTADPVDPYISVEPPSGNWPQVSKITSTSKYNIADFASYLNESNNIVEQQTVGAYFNPFKGGCGGNGVNDCSPGYSNEGNPYSCGLNGNSCECKRMCRKLIATDRIVVFTGRFKSTCDVIKEQTVGAYSGCTSGCKHSSGACGCGCGGVNDCSHGYSNEGDAYSCGLNGGSCQCKRMCRETTLCDYRYRLYNFFFVNLDTKFYSSSATETQIKNNECIGKLSSGGDWLAFCGDGKLDVTVAPNSSNGYIKFTNINNLSGSQAGATFEFVGNKEPFQNNVEYKLEGQQTFYIVPEQISDTKDAYGNYTISFQTSNLKIISAEITNLPCETITPTCSISGTTNALGKSNQSAVITTNVKAPLTIKAKGSARSNVTFYSSNGVSDCKTGGITVPLDTPYLLEKTTTFTFSGPTKTMWNWAHNNVAASGNATTGGVNFGHNLSLYKLKYSLNYASISSTTLSNQILRGYGYYGYGSSGLKTLITNDGYYTDSKYWDPCIDTRTVHNSGSVYSPLSSGQVEAFNFFVVCHGLTKNSRFLMHGGGPFGDHAHESVDTYISMEPPSGDWPLASKITSTSNYNIANFGSYSPAAADKIVIFTGRFRQLGASYETTVGSHSEIYYCQGRVSNCPEGTTHNDGSYYSCFMKDLSCGCYRKCIPCSSLKYRIYNFFFANLGTKSYSSSATASQIKNNECVGKLSSGGDWLAFCGDGSLSVTVAPTLEPSGTIKYTTASNGSASTTVTGYDYQTVSIDPSSHLYEPQGDGTYKINLSLTDIIISEVAMTNMSKIIRHKHPNIIDDQLKNVRIVDFNKNESSRPKTYGNVTFGKDIGGSLESHHKYELIDHLKYWTSAGANNQLYRTDAVAGDYFMQMMNWNSNNPSISWFYPSATVDYGNYPSGTYFFTGLHRVFLPWGKFETDRARFDVKSASVALVFSGYTLPINHVLQNSGLQVTSGTLNSTLNTASDMAAANVTSVACSKFKSSFPTNTRVYVIKYNTTDNTLNSCGSDVKTYSATSEADLLAKLQEIAADIKSFAAHLDARVEE
ncbi:MAG: hypothetical protein LBJ45_02105 [Holosporaceae bacterium]|jgi:hypothetical protein|nr:hypothetical protein [Holosporaceae bacterium]